MFGIALSRHLTEPLTGRAEMQQAATAYPRKIDPGRSQPLRPDGTPDDNDRVEIGPTALAFAEWAEAGITAPNLDVLRSERLTRLVATIRERDLGGVLLTDPLNIRYATDSSNMQLWNTHNSFRACFVGADGYMVLWDFHGSEMLSAFNPLVREVRTGASSFYFVSGDGISKDARKFAADVDDVLRSHAGSNRRIAVDKLMIHAVRAFDALGFEISDGEEVLEKSRSVKGKEGIAAMRCAVHACDRSLEVMREAMTPGMTENDVWSVLHAENIRRGGEWIETRLLSSGTRTNPWFQECGPRTIAAGEILAFDTDLVSCYGMCCDISRTWLVGDAEPNAEQKRIYREAHAQIHDNMAIVHHGTTLQELTFGGRPLPPEFEARRYSVKMHGVGLCDEWPAVYYPIDYREGAYDYTVEPGMMMCVEVYIGASGGHEGVKLEEQILITDYSYEVMSGSPFEDRFL
jgi:Xaa-Pro dipeptidase